MKALLQGKFKAVFFILFALSVGCSTDENLIDSSEQGKWTFMRKNNSGLIGDLVTALYTDSKGNIWIGTTAGLSKFDGDSFINYSETNGPLTNNKILSIMEDRDQNIFVGTEDGLNLFDGNQWLYFPLFADVEVNGLVESNNGDVWVGTYGFGTIQLFYAGSYVQHFDNFCGDCNFVNALYKNNNGSIWIGSEAGLKLYSNGSFQFFTVSDGLAGQWISAIGPDNWGNMWFGSFDTFGITRLRNSNFEEVSLVSSNDFNWVRDIQVDRGGTLWIAADDGGLIYFDGSVMRKVYDVFDGEYVTALTIGPDGALWVGTEGGGVARYLSK